MQIDREKCTGCEACHPYCTVAAIHSLKKDEGEDLVSIIDQDECVECGVCYRAKICPTDAIYPVELKWPRSVRGVFSDPITVHKETGLAGRGTEEMKTNDVTGRIRRGHAGVAIELGRPGVGTRFRDVDIMAQAVAKAGAVFEPKNPVTFLMVNKATGKIREDILNEKVLSAIIECGIEINKLENLLSVIKATSSKLDTVFSLDLIRRMGEKGEIETLPIAKRAGFALRPNTKNNIGFGRPLFKEDK
ncbi:MAG: 4Fe-4S dicluster domain-containing protein [Deltaproteobacteria bacterium]|nr:4Fe-4S dicluster domain-containing protein [Deltaproteobacteria bacterium]